MDSSLKKILRFLANPFMLSVLPAAIIILLIPIKHERHLLELENHIRRQANELVHYEDLDGDGYSEEIRLTYIFDRTRFSIMRQSGSVIDEWSLDGHYEFYPKQNLILSGDYNSNGRRELFFFTLSNDSIFVHGPFDFKRVEDPIRKRFIALVGPGRPNHDPKIIAADMEDLDGDGTKELIFGIFTGYSLFPRQVFAYFIDRDSLITSPESYFQFSDILQADITGDGKREIILSGSASGNIAPNLTKYHDYSNWLMVLDQNLQFLFEPVEIPGRFNGLRTIIVPGENGPEIGCILASPIGERQPVYLRFSSQGVLIGEIPLDNGIDDAWVSTQKDGTPVIGMTLGKTDLVLFDLDLTLKKLVSSNGFFGIKETDLDGDGHPEMIAFNPQNSKLLVFRSGFRHPAYAEIYWSDLDVYYISARHRGAYYSQISFQIGQDHYLLNYGPNPLYYLKFLIYLGIYLSVLSFAWLMQRLQRRQMLRTYETEKKITELQLSLVKNQLDPHFSLNALNAIVQAARNNQIDVVEEGLIHFSGMYRNMLLTAGKLHQSLEEELTFTKNYLALEKLRFADVFDYEIDVSPEVDQSMMVPKLIIQVYAENAVKHGLVPKGSDGKLRIAIFATPTNTDITITDNGVGRGFVAAEEKKRSDIYISTGKGLALMKEFYELYRRYYHRIIESQITDIFDSDGSPAGTSVLISISLHHETEKIKPSYDQGGNC